MGLGVLPGKGNYCNGLFDSYTDVRNPDNGEGRPYNAEFCSAMRPYNIHKVYAVHPAVHPYNASLKQHPTI